MKRIFILIVAALFSIGVYAQWTKPHYEGSEMQFSTEGSDTTLYYLYNEEAGAFFTQGNAWGTQASYTSEGPDLRVMFVKYVPDGGEWDGKTFIIKNFCLVKNSWKELFIDNDQRIFVDRGSQGDYFWECTRNGDSYRFFGAEMNPVYNCIDYEGCYMGIDRTNAGNVLFPFLDMYDEGAAENYLVDWKLIPALSSEPNPTNNLIDDASFGFEDGTTGGWKMGYWNNQGAVSAVAPGWNGSAYCMELAPNGNASQNYEAQLPYNLDTPMQVGKTYNVSFYAKAENEGAEIEFGAEYSPWAAHNKSWDGNMIALTTDWALYELELKVTDDYPADGLNSLHINFGKTSGKVYIDHIVLKEVAAPVTKNTFVLSDLTVSQGSQATLQIGLDNSDEITGFQFDLVLPEGVSVQKDGVDYVVNLSSGRASYRNHNVSSNMQGDGSLRVVCSSNSNKVFAGSTGTLVEIPLEISQSIATGSYGVKLKNIELATPALVKYNPTDVVSTMTVESGTSAPTVAPVKVESIVGNSYEGIAAGIEGDIAMEVAEYLGVTKAEEVAMATYDEKGNLVTENGGRGETDGWRNAEGAFVNWGTEGFTYYVEPYAELDNGAWSFGAYVGSAPGAVTAPIDFTQKVRFSANGKSVEFPITLSYVNRSELKIEVQEEVDVPAFAYDYALGYEGGQGRYDTSMVEDAIGCSAADAEVVGFNPSTGEFVRDAMSTYDGWFNAEGAPSDWDTPAAFVVKFYNDGTFWYCVRDDVAKPGVTYKASWLLVNPETGDAVQYNFVMKDSKAQDGEELDGIYYLQNVESGEWLGGGNSWGTQASLIKHPNPFYIKIENGKYTIDSFTYNRTEDHYLGNMGSLYLDCPVAYWDIDKVDDGVFTLSLDGNYIGYDGTSVVAEFAASDSSATQWRLISKDDMLKNFNEATQSKPVDATFLIQVPNFSRSQAYTDYNQSPWTVEAANIQLSGGNNTNNCAESWRSSNGFDVYQTLTDIPNGLYKLDVQGAVCDYAGTFENLAYAYADEQTSAFISSSKWAEGIMEDGENSIFAMSESFTAGKYQLEPIFVTVTDGTLRVGVRSSRTDTWAVWDNFELTYLGEINSFTVDVVSENKNKGMVSISSASYDESTHTAMADDEVTVTATPNSGYTFWKWHENGADISYENPYKFTLDGDREIVAQFVLLGDVYEDGTVDVADLTETVGYILRSEIPDGRTMLAADVYKDDSVDVADYTMIAGIILDGSSSEVKSRGAEGACRAIVNLQFDIELPATVDLTASQVVSALKQTPMRENHSILASTLSDGKIRVVVISSDNSPVNKAEDALMNITVPSDMRQGVYSILLRNVVLAYSDYTVKKFDNLSSTLSFTAPTSIDGIDGTSATDKQIFDISGRKLDKAVNGVNVINGKKVYNK